ncbi:ribosome silencing factor [Hallella multisaccharivorax]|uniref:ribosome silencing factor n=1 Tax=Hallella multisaccharivorax TaxID=310514 RepID=UPI00360DA783
MKSTSTEALLKTIVEAIEDKKGEDIRIVDLHHIEGAITNYFVICQGGSPAQVEAIAQSVGDKCRDKESEKPVGVNGLGSDQWVAIDFVDIIVHIFLPEPRAFYDLEHLWEDADISTPAHAQVI